MGVTPRLFAVLSDRCKKLGIEFSCTPFYLDAVNELEPFVDFYKVASYELLWEDLLTACARTKKDIIISTGMANLDEILSSVELLRQYNCDPVFALYFRLSNSILRCKFKLFRQLDLTPNVELDGQITLPIQL